jgi:hypothetical protein
MKKLAKWTLGIAIVIVGLGLLPYLILYVGHIRSQTVSTQPVKSPNGQYEAYVVYKTANWTEAKLRIRGRNGRTLESFPVTGEFRVEDVQWSPDSSIAAVMFWQSSLYGIRRPGLYGVQAMDTSGRSCESFGDFDIPVDDRKETANIDSWGWTQPRTIRFDLRVDSETRSKQVNVCFRIIDTGRDFRMVRTPLAPVSEPR